ncbi:MAG: hypothetical protein OHK0045_03190 [Raineya sp.]
MVFAPKQAESKTIGTRAILNIAVKFWFDRITFFTRICFRVECFNNGDKRQEAGSGKQETGSKKQETRSRRQEAGDRKQEAGDRRQETGDRKQEAGDEKHETRGRI